MATSQICSIPNCGKPAHARGYCNAHYLRVRKHGDPSKNKAREGGAPRAFLMNVALVYEGDECLIWPFTLNSQGYGRLWHDGRLQIASRVVCTEAHGEPPTPAHQAAHSCGKGHLGCVTKRHLEWKTRGSNEADKIVHGTSNRGRSNGAHKLTENDVRAIRRLKGTMSQRAIAKLYGTSQTCISDVHMGLTWGWLS